MATSKPISSISYNTAEFLESRLERFVMSGVLSFWCYINHYGESRIDDEANGKDHKHLLLVPNKCVDMVNLGKELVEFFPHDPRHPLKCMPFRTSKVEEWMMYVLHDLDYLSCHGLEKEFHYDIADFKCSDHDYLHQLWVESKQAFNNDPAIKMQRFARAGMSFRKLVQSGAISVQQIRNAELYYSYFNGVNADGERGVLAFDGGMLVLPNGDIEWQQEIFGKGEFD